MDHSGHDHHHMDHSSHAGMDHGDMGGGHKCNMNVSSPHQSEPLGSPSLT